MFNLILDIYNYIGYYLITGVLFVGIVQILSKSDMEIPQNKVIANIVFWWWYLLGRLIVFIIETSFKIYNKMKGNN